MRRGQASLEYLFMVILALVLIAIFMKEFFDPRAGTIHKEGQFESNLETNVTLQLNKTMNSTDAD